MAVSFTARATSGCPHSTEGSRLSQFNADAVISHNVNRFCVDDSFPIDY
jgi:hypothetical protein